MNTAPPEDVTEAFEAAYRYALEHLAKTPEDYEAIVVHLDATIAILQALRAEAFTKLWEALDAVRRSE